MIIIFLRLLYSLIWIQTITAQCPDPSITRTVSRGAGLVTISQGTYGVVQYSASATFASCARGLLESAGTATLGSGATITGEGTDFDPVVVTVLSGTGVVASVTAFQMSALAPQATLSVVEGYNGILEADNGGVGIIDSGEGNVLLANNGGFVRGTGGFYANAAGGTMVLTRTGFADASVMAYSDGEITMTGSSYIMDARDTGRMTAFGTSGTCSAQGQSAICSVSGSSMYVSLSDQGYGYLGGTDGFMFIDAGGTGYITGSGNSVQVAPAGYVTVAAEADADISQSAMALISSGVGKVRLRSDATGTMLLGATLTAEPGATPTATAQATTITSIGEVDGATIFAARANPSFERRRAAAAAAAAQFPMPTSGCSLGQVMCPDTHRKLQCVDTTSHLFNCGGCALLGQGIDCTDSADGDVACVASRCVAKKPMSKRRSSWF